MIIGTSATPFLKTLLTTTSTPTHISDFRNRPRSDSRADKPDDFPGFDFIDEPTTTFRPRTPTDFYTRVIGGIVSQGRQAYERIINNLQKYEINRRANLRRNIDVEFVPYGPYAIVTSRTTVLNNDTKELTDDDDEELTKKSSKEQNWPKKYFSAVIASAGINKLRNASDPEYLNKIIGTSATYINPLRNAWNRATMKLNLVRDTTTTITESPADSGNNDAISNITSPPQPPNAENIQTNYQVSNSASSSLGFGYAFSKYLNFMMPSKGYGNNGNDDDDNDDDDVDSSSDDENKTISERSELSDDMPWGDANLNNNNTMGVVDGADFPIERIDEQTDNEDDNSEDSGDDDDNNDDDDDESNENGIFDAGNFGIFILEIFGTIAGLTWGAFSQIQNLFTQNGN